MWTLIVSIVKSIATLIGMAKDKQLRDDGANAQKVVDLTADNQALTHALENSNLSDADISKRLRDGGF